MADQVGQRLLGLKVNAGNVVPQLPQQHGKHLGPGPGGGGVHAQDVFAAPHRFGMLVPLGPAGSPDEMQDVPPGVLFGSLECFQLGIRQGGRVVGTLQGGSGRERHVDLNAALVEFGEEIVPQPRELPRRHGHAGPRQQHQQPGMVHAEADQRGRHPLERPQKQPVPMLTNRLRLRQQE